MRKSVTKIMLPLSQKIYAAWTQYTGSFNVFQDVLPALNLPMTDARKAAPPALPFERAITLEGVGYRYPGGDTDVLSDISLTIPKGSRTPVIGHVEAGRHGPMLAQGHLVGMHSMRCWQ